MSNIKGITIEIDGSTDKLDRALRQVNSTSKDLSKELKEIHRELKFDPKSTEMLAQKQRVLKESVENTTSKIELLKKAQEEAAAALARGDIGQAEYDKLGREIHKAESQLKYYNDELKKIDTQKIVEHGKEWESAGDKIASVGGDLTKKITVPLVGAGTAMGKFAMDNEATFAKVKTLLDTETDFKAYYDTLSAGARETGKSNVEFAEAVYMAMSSGVEQGKAVEFTTQAMKLATAGFTDGTSAVDIMTTALNAYGMEASEAEKVSDLLIKTQDLGKITVEWKRVKLRKSLTYSSKPRTWEK